MAGIYNKKMFTFIGKYHRGCTTESWLFPCYFCEWTTGNCISFCGCEVYACKSCYCLTVSRDGTVSSNRNYKEVKEVKEVKECIRPTEYNKLGLSINVNMR